MKLSLRILSTTLPLLLITAFFGGRSIEVARAAAPTPQCSGTTTNTADCYVYQGVNGALSFSPSTVTIQAGKKVTWYNDSSGTPHTTTSDIGDTDIWDSMNMNPGASYSHTFNTPGSFPYHCSYHQGLGMVGTIKVTSTTAARLMWVHVGRAGSHDRVSWNVANQRDIAAFVVHGGNSRPAGTRIQAWSAQRYYHVTIRGTVGTPVYLDVILRNGARDRFGPFHMG